MARSCWGNIRGSLSALLMLGLTTVPLAAQNVEPIVWVNQVNVTATGSTLAEACNGCGNAGAESQQTLASGDGYVEFVPSTFHDVFSVGIGSGAPSTNVANIEFALRFAGNGIVEVRENGTYVTETRYAQGERFQIAVDRGAVSYYKYGASNPNPSLIHTNSRPTLQYPLKVEAVMLGKGTQVQQVYVQRATAADTKISWTNISNAAANDNTLTANGNITSGGAQSNETLTGNGYVEFTAIETDKMRAIGLDHQNTDNTFQDIDFAIVLRQAATPTANAMAEVWQSGKYISDIPYRSGDRFRIAIENGVVKYYKYANGSLVPIPANDASVSAFPVHVDAALYDAQASIADVTGTRTN
jgi:hypothetical protein